MGYLKPKKRVKKLEERRKYYDSQLGDNNRFPGYRRPGSQK